MKRLAQLLLAVVFFNVVVGDTDANLLINFQTETLSKHSTVEASACQKDSVAQSSCHSEQPSNGDHHGDESHCRNCHVGHCSFTLARSIESVWPNVILTQLVSPNQNIHFNDVLSSLERPPRA